jgi:formylglycine-generating enzyme required for sulfatase activity
MISRMVQRQREIDLRRLILCAIGVLSYGAISLTALGQEKPLASAEAPAPGKVWTVPDLGLQMVYVEPGSFSMGSNTGDADERPVHTVGIGSGLWIGKYEVTNAQYQRFVRSSGYDGRAEADSDYLRHQRDWARFASSGDDYPVVAVSWHNATAFCRWLTANEGQTGRLPNGYVYRLPTEAEWEYAARGGKHRLDPANQGRSVEEVAWHSGNSGNKTHPVGQKKPNGLGLHDMLGNVWEWCYDWYGADYYGSCPSYDPPGPPSGTERVARGGSWHVGPELSRVSVRAKGNPRGTDGVIGFRVVLAPPLARGAQPIGVGKSYTNTETGVARSAGTTPPVAGEDWTVGDLGLEMVYVERGSFKMGSRWSDSNNERPVHRVRISRGFWIGRYEVTVYEYDRFIKESGYDGRAEAGSRYLGRGSAYINMFVFTASNYPRTYVSWQNAAAFCRWLTDRERVAGRLPAGYVYQLPTEAQWEYAARGGAKGRGFEYPGSNNHDEVAWYNCQMQPIGRKKPNELGLYDMAGNAAELCHDWYDGDYYSESPSSDPPGPASGTEHVVRGGHWFTIEAVRLCTARRGLYDQGPLDACGETGFRVALSPELTEASPPPAPGGASRMHKTWWQRVQKSRGGETGVLLISLFAVVCTIGIAAAVVKRRIKRHTRTEPSTSSAHGDTTSTGAPAQPEA